MCVSFVYIFFQVVVPRQCAVAIQCVSSAHSYVFEERVFLDELGNGEEILHGLCFARCLLPYKVWLVER